MSEFNNKDTAVSNSEYIKTNPQWLKTIFIVFMVINPIMVLFMHVFISAPFIILQFFIMLLLYAVKLENMTDDVKKVFRFYSIELFILTMFIFWFRFNV